MTPDLTNLRSRPAGGEDFRPGCLALGIARLAAFLGGHRQRGLQLRNRSVQLLCMGLAGLVLHEGRMPW